MVDHLNLVLGAPPADAMSFTNFVERPDMIVAVFAYKLDDGALVGRYAAALSIEAAQEVGAALRRAIKTAKAVKRG